MKSSKPKGLSQKTRLALKRQVQEYVDRYHPQMGEVSVTINPRGTVASVRSFSKRAKNGNHSRRAKEQSNGDVAR
jgi:hypothetical protein